jgi:hypothetical protein
MLSISCQNHKGAAEGGGRHFLAPRLRRSPVSNAIIIGAGSASSRPATAQAMSTTSVAQHRTSSPPLTRRLLLSGNYASEGNSINHGLSTPVARRKSGESSTTTSSSIPQKPNFFANASLSQNDDVFSSSGAAASSSAANNVPAGGVTNVMISNMQAMLTTSQGSSSANSNFLLQQRDFENQQYQNFTQYATNFLPNVSPSPRPGTATQSAARSITSKPVTENSLPMTLPSPGRMKLSAHAWNNATTNPRSASPEPNSRSLTPKHKVLAFRSSFSRTQTFF